MVQMYWTQTSLYEEIQTLPIGTLQQRRLEEQIRKNVNCTRICRPIK